jgi:CRP-like cAMP-binding protein
MSKDAKLDRLANVALFSGLSRRQLERVAEITDEVDVPAGRILARQGEPAHVAYVVVSGEAAVSVDGQEVGTIGADEMVGEMGLIDGGPRAATVTAKSDMDLYVIEPGRFGVLLDEVPGLTKELLIAVTRRLRNADRLLHQH